MSDGKDPAVLERVVEAHRTARSGWPAYREAILAALEAGFSYGEIARAIGLTRQAIHQQVNEK